MASLSDKQTPKVVIVAPWLRHYNAAFLAILRDRLDQLGVAMDVVYGHPSGAEAGRGDTVSPDWAIEVNHRDIGVGRRRFTWQPHAPVIRDADLVVVQQASRLLLNYYLLAKQQLGGPQVAFWGHGRNFQADSLLQSVAEQAKRMMTRQSHWFFAYTDLTARVLAEHGYPADRITVVKNSIDTVSLAEARDRVSDADIEKLRTTLGLAGDHVGIFCGAMYSDKRLDFLVESAKRIRIDIPDFELICVGDGVDRPIIDRAAGEHPWIHAVGPRFGDDLALHFALASVYLLPGLVGLTVLDSFVFETPMVTTSDAKHSPEIEYLKDGVNGLIVEDASVESYSDVVVELLSSEDRRQELVAGCVESAREHSMEEMAERFADGVMLALAADK